MKRVRILKNHLKKLLIGINKAEENGCKIAQCNIGEFMTWDVMLKLKKSFKSNHLNINNNNIIIWIYNE